MIDPVADIRLATADDKASILRMMEAFNTFESIPFAVERLAAAFDDLLAHPDWGVIHLAEVGGRPAGYTVLAYGFDFEFGGRDAFICELWVDDRDRRMGVGTALLAATEAYAKDHGVNALHLIVRRENARAQVIYRRDGFHFDPRLLMSKTLGGA